MRRLALVLLTLTVMAVAAGCGGSDENAVTGVIIDVRASSFETAESITVRTKDGELWELAVDLDEESARGFPASHLRVHMAEVFPVRVWYRDDGGRHVAYHMEDVAE